MPDRSASICQGLCARPIRKVNTAIPKVERSTASFRPYLSDRLPQTGAVKIATNDVAAASTPAQRSTAPSDVTPRAGRNSGMIGATMLKATLMTNCTATMVHRVRRQYGESPVSVRRAVVSFIAASIRAWRALCQSGGIRGRNVLPANPAVR